MGSGGSSHGEGIACLPSWAPGWPGPKPSVCSRHPPAWLSLTLLPLVPAIPWPRCCPFAPPALPDRERPLMAPLLVLLGRRVAARALVLLAVSSKWDHLGEQRDISASALGHPYAPARPLHPGMDEGTCPVVGTPRLCTH